MQAAAAELEVLKAAQAALVTGRTLRLPVQAVQRLVIVHPQRAARAEPEELKALLERQVETAALLVERLGLLSPGIHLYHGLPPAPEMEQ